MKAHDVEALEQNCEKRATFGSPISDFMSVNFHDVRNPRLSWLQTSSHAAVLDDVGCTIETPIPRPPRRED